MRSQQNPQSSHSTEYDTLFQRDHPIICRARRSRIIGQFPGWSGFYLGAEPSGFSCSPISNGWAFCVPWSGGAARDACPSRSCAPRDATRDRVRPQVQQGISIEQ